MRNYAVIVAGGAGTRMGGGIPKQFRNLNGKPLLWWSMKAFHDENPATELILVLPGPFIGLWKDFFGSLPEGERFSHKITEGGATRTESVRNGLKLIQDKDSLVAVHDGARPLVTPDLISRGWKTASEQGAGVPVVNVTDSLRLLVNNGSKAVDRSDYVAVQTPQVFRTDILISAYDNAKLQSFTDDASVVEAMGQKISLFEGSPHNIKVTNPLDIDLASILLKRNG